MQNQGEKGSETPEENAKQVSDGGIRNISGLSWWPVTTQSRNPAFLFQSTKLDLTNASGCAGKLVGKKCWLEQIQNCQWRQHRFCTGRLWSGVFEGWWENMKLGWLFFIHQTKSLHYGCNLDFPSTGCPDCPAKLFTLGFFHFSAANLIQS